MPPASKDVDEKILYFSSSSITTRCDSEHQTVEVRIIKIIIVSAAIPDGSWSNRVE